MLSGTLPPSSANIIQRPKLLCEDESQIRRNSTTSNQTTASLATVVSNASGTSSASQTQQTNTSERSRSDSNGRSAALERAYVHDVYENCEEPVGPIRPRVAQFLAGLDAGSLVCDVGCGNGRYLNSCNPLIYTIGVDRCYRLAKYARGKGSEVAICDNLELPFRDESFDAVLSLAVVHHFATTERRVGAIRELARILRIGGRVIISVWALEQRHKRFESQDVLVPWQPPKNRNSNISDDEDDEDFLPPYHAYTEDSTNSSRSAGDGDSSSLSSSSPGESCYSFVRRAIQKLAGGKKHPWFLESWNSKDTKHGSSLDYEDAKDLPIELRRLEDFDDLPEPPLSAGLKSRSLGSILNPPPRTIVRSRSSVPSLGAQIPEPIAPPAPLEPSSSSTPSRRPKLVKQKQSFCDDNDFPLPEFPSVITKESRLLLRKQSSLNEELMAESRLREKERVRKRIQKQMSLNEAFLCRSVFTKRLQVIREGFTTKLKSSTGNIERATKNGFVKIIQNIKGSPHQPSPYNYNYTMKNSYSNLSRNNSLSTPSTSSNGGGGGCGGMGTNCKLMNGNNDKNCCLNNSNNNSNDSSNCNSADDQKPRRHSRESGSDSSKDSSLQSDTSIESEDSFASVIYIPKTVASETNGSSSTTITTTTPAAVANCDLQHFTSTTVAIAAGAPSTTTINNNTFKMPSVPTSPLIMTCPTPAHSPAPPRCKLQANMVEGSRFTFEEAQIQKSDDPSFSTSTKPPAATTTTKITTKPIKQVPNTVVPTKHTSSITITNIKNSFSSNSKSSSSTTSPVTSTTSSKHRGAKITRQQIKDLPPIPKFKKAPSFPIVRRTSTAPAVPKLMSLEIFNPETDDLDSDSSEPSSPDSIDSVINALLPKSQIDDDLLLNNAADTAPGSAAGSDHDIDDDDDLSPSKMHINEDSELLITSTKNSHSSSPSDNCNSNNSGNNNSEQDIQQQQIKNVVNINLNNSDDSNKLCDITKKIQNGDNSDINNEQLTNGDASIAIDPHQRLVDFAEQLSAQLLKELDEKQNKKLKRNPFNRSCSIMDDQYSCSVDRDDDDDAAGDADDDAEEEEDDDDDPYLKKINGELRDLSNLRDELRERRLMLANLNINCTNNNNNNNNSINCNNNNNNSNCSRTTNQSDTIHEEDESDHMCSSYEHHTSYDDIHVYNNIDDDDDDDDDVNDDSYSTNNEKALLIQEDQSVDENNLYKHLSSELNNLNNNPSVVSASTSSNLATACSATTSTINNNNNSSNSNSINNHHHNHHTSHHKIYQNKLNNNNDSNNCNSNKNKLTNPQHTSNDSHQSADSASWEHSNSTGSLDSPSVGGSATHHRYYHVFREGELDSLINHHVASLHIVSSYYERASWCVVAEKVQVWTI